MTTDKTAQERCDEVIARATADLDAILADYPGHWWTTDDGQELRVIVCGPIGSVADATWSSAGGADGQILGVYIDDPGDEGPVDGRRAMGRVTITGTAAGLTFVRPGHGGVRDVDDLANPVGRIREETPATWRSAGDGDYDTVPIPGASISARVTPGRPANPDPDAQPGWVTIALDGMPPLRNGESFTVEDGPEGTTVRARGWAAFSGTSTPAPAPGRWSWRVPTGIQRGDYLEVDHLGRRYTHIVVDPSEAGDWIYFTADHTPPPGWDLEPAE